MYERVYACALTCAHACIAQDAHSLHVPHLSHPCLTANALHAPEIRHPCLAAHVLHAHIPSLPKLVTGCAAHTHSSTSPHSGCASCTPPRPSYVARTPAAGSLPCTASTTAHPAAAGTSPFVQRPPHHVLQQQAHCALCSVHHNKSCSSTCHAGRTGTPHRT